MALGELISRLERDAEARVGEVRAKAQAQAEALLAEAARATEAHRERELGVRRVERRARLDRELSEARQRAHAERLVGQHALLARVFAAARALIPEVAASPAYLEALPGHLAFALRYVEGMRVVVRCAPAFIAALQPVSDSRADVVLVEDATLPPGVLISSADDSVFIDDTLGARLTRAQPRLAIELLAERRGDP